MSDETTTQAPEKAWCMIMLSARTHINSKSAAVSVCAPLRPSISTQLRLPNTPRTKVSCRKASIAMATEDRTALHSLPGVHHGRDTATNGFIFQQTMYRIRDPKVSLDFYTRILGFTLLNKLDFPDMKFSLYFLGYIPADQVPNDPKDRAEWMFKQPATLELTHNWGTEDDPEFKGYHNGNSDPRGFGHIGLAVPDVEAACKRFEDLGVEFTKKPHDGKMKGIAFIKDPDGYLIEILNPAHSRNFVGWGTGGAAQ